MNFVASGELVVLGQRPAALSQEELILFRRENLGFVFQQYNLIPALTAAENVAVPLLASGVKRHQAVARGEEFLATLGMAPRARLRWRRISWQFLKPSVAAGNRLKGRCSVDRFING